MSVTGRTARGAIGIVQGTHVSDLLPHLVGAPWPLGLQLARCPQQPDPLLHNGRGVQGQQSRPCGFAREPAELVTAVCTEEKEKQCVQSVVLSGFRGPPQDGCISRSEALKTVDA